MQNVQIFDPNDGLIRNLNDLLRDIKAERERVSSNDDDELVGLRNLATAASTIPVVNLGDSDEDDPHSQPAGSVIVRLDDSDEEQEKTEELNVQPGEMTSVDGDTEELDYEDQMGKQVVSFKPFSIYDLEDSLMMNKKGLNLITERIYWLKRRLKLLIVR